MPRVRKAVSTFDDRRKRWQRQFEKGALVDSGRLDLLLKRMWPRPGAHPHDAILDADLSSISMRALPLGAMDITIDILGPYWDRVVTCGFSAANAKT